ncbi:MAG: NUMOD3 domain-containing DNA-binding protein, partial [Nanoarchaeota archaeon]|nr:NUMOD3 domain-containing DNA-binding protein [Nanoarchaeota archaeon]
FAKGLLHSWSEGLTKETDERVKRISIAHKGKKLSEEHKEKIRKANSGNKNPQYGQRGNLSSRWLGGISLLPYDFNFNRQFKTYIRERDNKCCQMCGKHRSQLNKELDIHHIDYNKKNSVEWNCISLCKSCHTTTNSKREYWTRFFQEYLYDKYKYECLKYLIPERDIKAESQPPLQDINGSELQ